MKSLIRILSVILILSSVLVAQQSSKRTEGVAGGWPEITNNEGDVSKKVERKVMMASWGDVVFMYGPQTDAALATPQQIDNMISYWNDNGFTDIFWRGEDLRDPNFIWNESTIYAEASFIKRITEEVKAHFDTTAHVIKTAHKYGMKVYMWQSVYDDGTPPDKLHRKWAQGFPWRNSFFDEHPELDTIDRNGKVQWGVRELAYPLARQSKVKDYELAVKRYPDLDGVYVYLHTHSDAPDRGDQYGFNPIIAKEYNKRYGIDILTDPRFDCFSPDFNINDVAVEKWRRLRGEYLTQLLVDIKTALTKIKPDIKIAVNTQGGDYFGPPFGNMHTDWRKWIQDDLVDMLVVRTWMAGGCGAYDFGDEGYLTWGDASLGATPYQDIREVINQSQNDIKLITRSRAYIEGTNGYYDSSNRDEGYPKRQRQVQLEQNLKKDGKINFINQDFENYLPLSQNGYLDCTSGGQRYFIGDIAIYEDNTLTLIYGSTDGTIDAVVDMEEIVNIASLTVTNSDDCPLQIKDLSINVASDFLNERTVGFDTEDMTSFDSRLFFGYPIPESSSPEIKRVATLEPICRRYIHISIASNFAGSISPSNNTVKARNIEILDTTTFDNCSELIEAGGYLNGDKTADCYVNTDDLVSIANKWLLTDTLLDYSLLADYWLECNDPANEQCFNQDCYSKLYQPLCVLEDGLHNFNYELVASGGATGSINDNNNGSWTIQKTNNEGNLFLVNRDYIKIEPNTTYLVTAQVEVSGNCQTNLMCSMPGAQRSPYPVSETVVAADSMQSLRLKIISRIDEKQLVAHLVVSGNTGSVIVHDICIEVISIAPENLFWGGDYASIKDAWTTVSSRFTYNTENTVEVDLADMGAIECDNLKWDADNIDAVEIGFFAQDEPGFITMSWTASLNDSDWSGQCSTAFAATADWQVLHFDISDEAFWSGIVDSLKFTINTNRKQARMGISHVRALDYNSIITNADRKIVTEDGIAVGWESNNGIFSSYVDLIKPRATYIFNKKAGSAECRLNFLDCDYNLLNTIRLFPSSGALGVVVPSSAMIATIEVDNDDTIPTLQLYREASKTALTPGVTQATGYPLNGQLSTVEIRGIGTKPMFIINSQEYNPLTHYLPDSIFTDFTNCGNIVREISAQNVHIFQLNRYLADMWTSQGVYSFASLKTAIQTVIANDPQAWIKLNIDVRAPQWWLALNPDEVVGYYGVDIADATSDCESMASQKWLNDSSVAAVAMIDYLKTLPEVSRIISLSLNAGRTSEWLWPMGTYGSGETLYSGYSVAAINAYRDWLKIMFNNDTLAMQTAYNEQTTFATISPPTPDERNAAIDGSFMDPTGNRKVMDYWQFRNDTVANNILALCSLVKQQTSGKWLTGTYYGYLNMFSRMYWALQEAGHLNLDIILNSPDVDFLYAPAYYTWRKIGLGGGFMPPVGSLTVNNKLHICEFDQRTFTENREEQWRNGRVATVEQTIGMMNRDFAKSIAHSTSWHWMEMLDIWYREPIIRETIGKEVQAYQQIPATDSGLTPIEVCVVSDLTSPLYTKLNQGDGVHPWIISELLRRIDESGFAWTQVLLSDLLTPGRVGSHKLYIMTNTFVISQSEQATLNQLFQSQNADVLWLYAPGAFNTNSIASTDNIHAMTGFEVEKYNIGSNSSMTVSADYGGETINLSSYISPWFNPIEQDDVTVIARDSDSVAAFVKRVEGDRNIYFSKIPNLSPVILRNIADEAGVWIYGDSNDQYIIGNGTIFLHSKTPGLKSISLPMGQSLKCILGPLKGTIESNQKWNSRAGITYGFVVEN